MTRKRTVQNASAGPMIDGTGGWIAAMPGQE